MLSTLIGRTATIAHRVWPVAYSGAMSRRHAPTETIQLMLHSPIERRMAWPSLPLLT